MSVLIYFSLKATYRSLEVRFAFIFQKILSTNLTGKAIAISLKDIDKIIWVIGS